MQVGCTMSEVSSNLQFAHISDVGAQNSVHKQFQFNQVLPSWCSSSSFRFSNIEEPYLKSNTEEPSSVLGQHIFVFLRRKEWNSQGVEILYGWINCLKTKSTNWIIGTLLSYWSMKQNSIQWPILLVPAVSKQKILLCNYFRENDYARNYLQVMTRTTPRMKSQESIK